jgi:hypothetical protein
MLREGAQHAGLHALGSRMLVLPWRQNRTGDKRLYRRALATDRHYRTSENASRLAISPAPYTPTTV